MGVHNLWELLAPVGRRVSVETLAGKRLAIDASIWMVQFMKAMRDEKGEMVRNAHLLGFFRRICKLLFLRTKPVFVFDGGTPLLKRRTVIARRKQRENAQAKIRKTAEKLFLNQVKAMRLNNLAEKLKDQKGNQNLKGKEVMLEQPETFEKSNLALEATNQELIDELLAASISAEEFGGLGNFVVPGEKASASFGHSADASASTSAAAVMAENEESDDDEEMILPVTDGNVDPAVLAALPPSMQLDLLVQMRERLMAENRQKYQKVKKAPQKFSELQIEAYLKTVAFRREIDEVQRAAAGKGVGGVQTSRIASEANREFIFSSSFSGDKQVLGSSGTEKCPEKLQSIGNQKPSSVRKIISASAHNASTEAVPSADENVETYRDERGRQRIHKSRAMGIRMTRDLQRNIDLIKELDRENATSSDQGKLGVDVGPSGKSDFGGPSLHAVEELNCNTFHSSFEKSMSDTQLHQNAHESETCIKISFSDDDDHTTLDKDDALFVSLVGGNSLMISSDDNSGSDVEWEDGITFSNMLAQEDKSKRNVVDLEDGSKTESDVEWEEGPSIADDKLSTKTVHVDSGNYGENGMEMQVENTEIPREGQKNFADITKTASKGSAEEEAALQEAIRRSLQDSTGKTSSSVSFDLEKSSYACNMHQSVSCSTQLSSKFGALHENDSAHFIENSHLSVSAEKEASAPSSSDLQTVSAFVAAVERTEGTTPRSSENLHMQRLDTSSKAETSFTVKKDFRLPTHTTVGSSSSSQTVSFADDTKNDNLARLSEISIGLGESVVEAEGSYPDADISVSRDEGTSNELLGASLEDELLVLGQEYKVMEDEQRKLERNADSVNSEMFVECQELLQMFGLPYIIAPMEAEAQCAYLELEKLVDGVVTDDSDVFLFGAQSVYKNIFDDRKYVETYLMKDIESELGLDRDKLIRMALLLGSDYTEGISGIGIVNAIEVVNAFPGEDGLRKFRDWVESPDPSILGKIGVASGFTDKNDGSNASINDSNNNECAIGGNSNCSTSKDNEDNESIHCSKLKQVFMNKHRNVSKNWHIPGSFPSDAVISAYQAPQVDKSTEPFSWGKPDIFSLRRLCWEKFSWANQKADELLLPVLKEYNKHETQLRLEAFYSFNERFAKIRSKRIKQAVKGITGRCSLGGTNDLQEVRERGKKTSGSTDDKSKKKRGDNVVRERKSSSNRTKKRGAKQAGSNRLSTEGEERIEGDTGSHRSRKRRGGKTTKIGGRNESSDSEPNETSTDDTNANSDELEHLLKAEAVESTDKVRRSKRARKTVSYLERDEVTDELTNSLSRSDQMCGSDEASKDTRSDSLDLHKNDTIQTVGDPFPDDGLGGDYLMKGGGFCAEEVEAEANNPADLNQMGGALVDNESECLQLGGGFCAEDAECMDYQEFEGGKATFGIDDISIPLDEVKEAGRDEHNHGVQGLPNIVASDSKLNQCETSKSGVVKLDSISQTAGEQDSPASVSAFRAIPFMKRKKRRS